MSTRTPSAELEQRILNAATTVLTDVGAGALTQRKVAEVAGVSPQSIYNRFDSKHDLLDAIANIGFLDLTEHLLNADGVALSSIEDPLDNIAEGLRRYRDFALANPRRYGAMFDADVPGFTISDRTLGTAFESLRVLIDAVARARTAGVIDEVDDLSAAQMIWGAAHGVLRFELTDVGFVDDWDAHFQTTIATMLRGLGAAGGR